MGALGAAADPPLHRPIAQYEASMSRAKKRDPKLFPEWLQMLQPKTSDGEESKGELSMTGRGTFGSW